jgi:hypothetical protein
VRSLLLPKTKFAHLSIKKISQTVGLSITGYYLQKNINMLTKYLHTDGNKKKVKLSPHMPSRNTVGAEV